MKLKRPQAAKGYRALLDQLYAEGKAAAGSSKARL